MRTRLYDVNMQLYIQIVLLSENFRKSPKIQGNLRKLGINYVRTIFKVLNSPPFLCPYVNSNIEQDITLPSGEINSY